MECYFWYLVGHKYADTITVSIEIEREKQYCNIDLDLAPTVTTAVKLGIVVDIPKTGEQTDTQNI